MLTVLPGGRRQPAVYGVAVRDSLFDVATVSTTELLEVAEHKLAEAIAKGLELGGVVRVDTDPAVILD